MDRAHTVEPATSAFAAKVQIRRAIEAEGIPYTIVSSNYFAGYSLPTLAQADSFGPPTDKVVIYGDGNTKGTFMYARAHTHTYEDIYSESITRY